MVEPLRPDLRLVPGGASVAPVRIPPHDVDAEGAVISAAILNPIALSAIVDLLRPEHFFSEAHRRIFEAVLSLRVDEKPIDIVSVLSTLRTNGRVEQVGGREYLVQVVDSAPAIAPTHARAYAETVFNHWRVRQTIALAQYVEANGYVGVPSAQAYLEGVLRSVASLVRQEPSIRQERTSDTLRRLVGAMQAASSPSYKQAATRGLLTGIEPLDALTGGLHAAQKMTVVALPGRGKTAFAIFAGMTAALAGIGVCFFSSEMTRDEIGERQLALLANVDSRRIRLAKQGHALSAEEWSRVASATERASALPFVVDDSHDLTIDEVCARTKRLADQMPIVDKAPLGLVILDYVQRLRAPSGFERRKKYEVVDYSTVRFKKLAQELKIAGLELAQQKTPERGKAPAKPSLGLAAESFQIEREADAVLYLHRKGKEQSDLLGIVAKQRGGGEAEFDLSFEGATGRFTDPQSVAASRDFLAPAAPASEPVYQHAFSDLVGDDQT